MGHFDSVMIVDAHRHAAWRDSRGAQSQCLAPTPPEVVVPVRSVLPLDGSPAVNLTTPAETTVLSVQGDLIATDGI
jgi:L-fucose mutarotase